MKRALEEFVRLYSNIHSSTQKTSVPYQTTDDKKTQKIQERMKKNFPKVIIAWNDDECILCGDVTTLDKAVQELGYIMFEYETFSVDKITFQYITSVHKQQLENLKKTYHVTVDLKADPRQNGDQHAVYIKPSKGWSKKYSSEDLRKAKEDFISLYQDFFSTKRMPVKCENVSRKTINGATEQTKKSFPRVMVITDDSGNEVIFCAEEKELDDAVRAFRTSAGLGRRRE